MKYLFWPPVVALVVVLMLCTGLLRIVFHLVWDFRFMGWREAYTFDGIYLFKDLSWKDVLMEIINPNYVIEDEDLYQKPLPKFEVGQLVRVVDLGKAKKIVGVSANELHCLENYFGKQFAVLNVKYDELIERYTYEIGQWGHYITWINEELLEEYVKPEDDYEKNNLS